MRAVTMPRWGMTMTEGKVASWLVAEGAPVTEASELLEIETSKITNVLEAPAAGVLRRRVVAEGEVVSVGALLGVIAEAQTSEADLDAFVARYAERAGIAPGEAAPDEQGKLVAAGAYRLNAASAGDGTPAILLLHGFGGEVGAWLFNQAELAAQHRVVALDLPGHGRSEPTPAPARFDDLVDAVAAASEALGLGRAHVVGHSLGGGIAIALAAGRPDLVASLTLIAPVGLGAEIDVEYVDGFLAADRRKPMTQALSRLFADPTRITKEMVEASLQAKRVDGVDTALRAIAGLFVRDGRQALDLAPALESVRVPVLLIWGEADRVIPPPARPAHRIAGAAHMPHMEAPAEVNRLIAAHVAAAGRAAG